MTEFYKDMELCYKPEVEKDRKDAARYRWLRLAYADGRMTTLANDVHSFEEMDQAIDDDMAARTAGNYEVRSNGPEGLNSQGMSGETMPDGAQVSSAIPSPGDPSFLLEGRN